MGREYYLESNMTLAIPCPCGTTGVCFPFDILAASFGPHSYALTEKQVPLLKATCPIRDEHDDGPSCFRIMTDGSHNL